MKRSDIIARIYGENVVSKHGKYHAICLNKLMYDFEAAGGGTREEDKENIKKKAPVKECNDPYVIALDLVHEKIKGDLFTSGQMVYITDITDMYNKELKIADPSYTGKVTSYRMSEQLSKYKATKSCLTRTETNVGNLV